MDIVSPLSTTADLKRLQAALVAGLAQGGLPLPEDDAVLDFVVTSMRFGNLRAALAVQGSEAVGIVAWRVERDAGFVVLFCVLPDAPPPTAGLLLAKGLHDLAAGEPLHGIYAELSGLSAPVRAALEAAGFVGVARTIMRCDLRAQVEEPSPRLAAGYRLRPWADDWLEAAADVIYEANIGTLDALIIPEIQSRPGTRRIVYQVVQGRYGLFDAAASGLALSGEEAVGVTLVTRRAGGLGFTAEICVLGEHRRRGLARSLMTHTHGVLRADGVSWSTLGVTAGNPARHLYEALGYAPVGEVWSYVHPRPAGWPV